jgi:D-tagatose-1,6-bisphosphate aldolase subunit GatZ/KbaZ
MDSSADTDDALRELADRRTEGQAVGLTSVCSAHPLVIEATLLEAGRHRGQVLIEATSNQVNQDGGYTGLDPAVFRDDVLSAADRAGVERSRVLLGGDHLGPTPWRQLPAADAMARAETLVSAYAAAGYTKIHLDCSTICGDDAGPLSDAIVSERAARLLAASEEAAPDPARVSYVIGTEVPVPGGAIEAIDSLAPTTAAAARATLAAHREAFVAAGLDRVWPRMRALVVQPGVEFDEWEVIDYEHAATGELRAVLRDVPGMVFEAHSTDYQLPSRLSALVADGWAVLKVGPALTFALREALFALETIERELVAPERRSRLRETAEAAMLADPSWWERYYGEQVEPALARAFSFSDRIRYYWPTPPVRAAQERLLENLSSVRVALPLLSQALPAQFARVRAGELEPSPRALVLDHITDVLRTYRAATAPGQG